MLLLVLVAVGAQADGTTAGSHIPQARQHRLAQIHRTSDSTLDHGIRHQVQSDNWSGYVVSSANTGLSYTSAQATWIVPTATFASGRSRVLDQYSSLWVGIGGDCVDLDCEISDSTLIQLGTEQDVSSNGSKDYYVWYEMLPNESVTIPRTVRPGDVITASITCIASCTSATQTWTMAMTDSTAQWSWSQSFAYASSRLSADWIVEAPASDANDVLPLANFGTATFQMVSANGVNPNLSLSTDGFQMTDTAGGRFGESANPSAPVNGDGFSVCWGSLPSFTPCSYQGVASPLVAAILPSSRSVKVGNTATAFATIINGGTSAGSACSIAPTTSLLANFSYQATNPATNATIGTANTPITIAAGGSQSFVIAVTPTAALAPTEVAFSFSCANLSSATSILDVNTLLLSAAASAPPDIVALAATPSGDGTLDVSGTAGSNAFAVATVNVGTASAITASASVGTSGIPLAVTLCQTDPTTGACLTPIAASVSTTIAAGATPTFAIFATAGGAIPFQPAANRIFVQFADASGAVRGLTSVAVATR
ncbi:MAG TPA: G1 family glutamic endopeptidase [Aliidongia sp.]|uniref:G1 family glutamic endopeptidase n=1 Tax=Aliidongia sp. TaxID=1914230 RepID=UPI002DDD4943|nr:G1 family glutamic endopeptidase [Aliidongia sp.]HEV2673094.1 G1 family glutamic endopeptidase [Aliidongia sp.]